MTPLLLLLLASAPASAASSSCADALDGAEGAAALDISWAPDDATARRLLDAVSGVLLCRAAAAAPRADPCGALRALEPRWPEEPNIVKNLSDRCGYADRFLRFYIEVSSAPKAKSFPECVENFKAHGMAYGERAMFRPYADYDGFCRKVAEGVERGAASFCRDDSAAAMTGYMRVDAEHWKRLCGPIGRIWTSGDAAACADLPFPPDMCGLEASLVRALRAKDPARCYGDGVAQGLCRARAAASPDCAPLWERAKALYCAERLSAEKRPASPPPRRAP